MEHASKAEDEPIYHGLVKLIHPVLADQRLVDGGKGAGEGLRAHEAGAVYGPGQDDASGGDAGREQCNVGVEKGCSVAQVLQCFMSANKTDSLD